MQPQRNEEGPAANAVRAISKSFGGDKVSLPTAATTCPMSCSPSCSFRCPVAIADAVTDLVFESLAVTR